VVVAAALIVLVLGGVMMSALWSLATVMASQMFEKPMIADYIRLLAPAIPLFAFIELLGQIARGLGHANYAVLVTNILAPVVLLLALVVLKSLGVPEVHVCFAVLAGCASASIAGSWAVAIIVGPRQLLLQIHPTVQSLLRYAIPVFAGSILSRQLLLQ